MERLPGAASLAALPPVARVVIVGAIVAGIWAVLAKTTREAPTAESPPAAEVLAPAARPQVPPVDACSLLTEAEIDEAMGLVEPGDFLILERDEGCVWQLASEGEVVDGQRSVQIAPGDPSDFGPDAQIEGVRAVPVPGVGDVAAWFGGEGGGVLSVVRGTDLGYLFVRVALTRPDLDDPGRLEATKRLAATATDRLELGRNPPAEAELCDLVTDAEAEQILGPHRAGWPGAPPRHLRHRDRLAAR